MSFLRVNNININNKLKVSKLPIGEVFQGLCRKSQKSNRYLVNKVRAHILFIMCVTNHYSNIHHLPNTFYAVTLPSLPPTFGQKRAARILLIAGSTLLGSTGIRHKATSQCYSVTGLGYGEWFHYSGRALGGHWVGIGRTLGGHWVSIGQAQLRELPSL